MTISFIVAQSALPAYLVSTFSQHLLFPCFVRWSSPNLCVNYSFGHNENEPETALISCAALYYWMLFEQGQESAGIATTDGVQTHFHKEMGLGLACFTGAYPMEIPQIGDKKVFERIKGERFGNG